MASINLSALEVLNMPTWANGMPIRASDGKSNGVPVAPAGSHVAYDMYRQLQADAGKLLKDLEAERELRVFAEGMVEKVLAWHNDMSRRHTDELATVNRAAAEDCRWHNRQFVRMRWVAAAGWLGLTVSVAWRWM